MLYLLLRTGAISLIILLASAAPAVKNNKLENNQLPDNDFLGLNRYDLPNFSSESTKVDIQKTISQVEQILKLNPQLPRISREEILVLLKNITNEDTIRAQTDAESIVGSNISNGNKAKVKNNKKTMVVLPYKAEDTSNGDVSELFTKAPRVTFEPQKLQSKPIVVLDEDEEDSSDEDNTHEYKNHKYSKADSNKKPNGFNGQNPSTEYWKDQAHKVMEDLEKQNQPKKIALSIPFKKMPETSVPTGFSKNNEITNDVETSDLQSINKLIGGNGDNNNNGFQTNTVGAFKPLALYDFKSLPEPVTNFELILPKDDEEENLVAHSSSSFVDNNNNGNVESLFDGINGKKSDYSIAPKVDTSAYMSFKPLPLTDSPSNGDSKGLNLDDILQQYGLNDETLLKTYLPLPSSEETPPEVGDVLTNTDFVEDDMFPASMTSVLTDMGLTKKKGRKMENNNKNDDSYSYNAPAKVDTKYGVPDKKYGIDPMNDDEMNGVLESLNMIKREMDDETTNAVVKEVTNEKNGKKSNGNTENTEANAKLDDESSDTKEESESKDKGPSFAALEDSFGASPADDDPAEAVLPPPRRNGFYYMVDWNSFLEVGEEGNSRRINIRFEPKLGDPQMFIFGNKNNN